MFRRRNLLKDGATAKAVILEADKQGGMPGEAGGYTATQYDLRLDVHFDDGSRAEATCQVGGFILGTDLWFAEGDIVPVRYDPDDRSKIEVDVPALEAQRDAEQQALQKEAIAQGEAQLAGGGAPGSGPVGTSAAEDRRERKEQARAGRERQKARRAAQLEKLTRKHDQGLISDEEFEAKKKFFQGGG